MEDKDIFKEEHRIFRESVRQFVEKEINPIAEECEKAQEFPRQILPKLGKLGYLGLGFPEKYGGGEADYLMKVVFVEELASCDSMGIALSILSHTDMSCLHINRFGSEDQKERYLPSALKGEKLFGVAVSEANAGSDVSAIQTTAKRQGDYYVINGNKMFITNSTKGDVLILAAKTDPKERHKGISLFIFETDTAGFEVSKLDKMVWKAGDTGLVSFDNCMVPKENLIGEEGSGFKYIMQGFENERMVLSVAAVAGAQRCLNEAIRYARERTQFGRFIKDFQVIKHKLVDMSIQIEAARQLNYHCAALLDQGKDCRTEVMMAKILASEMAYRIASDAVQIHGGYGLMEEYIVSRLYRDLRVFSIGGGTSEILKEALARKVVG